MALLPSTTHSSLLSPLPTRRPLLANPNLSSQSQPTAYRSRYRRITSSSPSPSRLSLRSSLDPPIDSRRLKSNVLLQLSAPIIFFFVGLSAAACAVGPNSPALDRTVPATSESADTVIDGEKEDDEFEREFERWKNKKFPWTVPLRIVALRGSFPAAWLKDFVQSQSKRLKLKPEFRGSLQAIHQQLTLALESTSINPKSVMAADIVTIGDTWLSHAIRAGLIEPITGAEDEHWFKGLNESWKTFLCRNGQGVPDSNGSIWGAPYRWGTVVIAYKKDKFKKNQLASVEDWADLWRPELAGKISMIDSPREVVGSVLKYMGASYNTKDIDSEIVGGRNAVMQNLALLQRQVRLFDSTHYLKAFTVGDVWVAVGWSSDVIPTAKRMSNVAVIAPKSGSSFWADIWAVPAASKFDTDKIGGRIRGPSPLIHQWIDFCLQPARAFAFQQEILPGATPSVLQLSPLDSTASLNVSAFANTGRPTLDSNLISGVPPPEILAKCEFLEPLSEKASIDYQWLIDSMKKRSSGNFLSSLFNKITAKFRSPNSNPAPV